MNNMIYKKELKQKYDVDVFIAGGGPSGFAAATACARQGKSVFLAESRGSFGGAGTVGMVPAFMCFGDGVNFLAGGIGREIRDALYSDRSNNAYGYAIHAETLKRLYDNMAVEAGFHFSFFTTLSDVIVSNGRIEYAVISSKSGMYLIKAKVFIDATGDGDLCVWAGAQYELGDQNQNTMPATLCSLWANIDFSRRDARDDSRLEEAINDHIFTLEDRHLPGIADADPPRGVGGGNIGHCFNVNPIDEASLTKAMLWGRKTLPEYERYYNNYLKGFEHAGICSTADLLGVRESRRIKGDYELCAQDFLDRAVFEDEIGRYCYPVDIHIMAPDKESYEAFKAESARFSYAPGESYGIPYRSLLPAGLSNVLVTGKCISTDRQMQASIRVMPGCYITGQAAGIAAALACSRGSETRGIDIKELQRRIKNMGGFLPNVR